MSNEIPTTVSETIWVREQGRCLRCGGPSSERAHRRTRSVHDQHTHCACNLIRMCHTCHQVWAHAHPVDAMKAGFIVSRHVPEPGKVEVQSWYGTIYLLCDGDIEFVVKGSNDDGPRGQDLPVPDL